MPFYFIIIYLFLFSSKNLCLLSVLLGSIKNIELMSSLIKVKLANSCSGVETGYVN